MTRDFARGTPFARELAQAVSGRLVVMAEGSWPISLIAFGDRHLLLVRDYPDAVYLSLPEHHAWTFERKAQWPSVVAEIVAAVAAYRPTISLGDVLVVVRPVIERHTQTPGWDLSFSRGLVPTEVTIDHGRHRLRLAQLPGAVRIEVRVKDALHTEIVDSPAKLASIAAWCDEQLSLADRAIADADRARAEEAERKRRAGAAIFDEVLAAMRRGERFTTGGARYNETFFLEGTTFRCAFFDEGANDVRDATEQQVRGAVERDPDAFEAVLGRLRK